MIAIMGVTGQVGGNIGRKLIAQGKPVRAIVRSESKAEEWRKLGAEIAIASTEDAAALTQAFTGAEAVFAFLPPVFDPSPGFPESRANIDAIREALAAARPGKVVALSTIGAQVTRDNLLLQLHLFEEALRTLDLPVTFLRPTWFIENTQWPLPTARETGIFYSHLYPLDKPFTMVAVEDIGQLAAQLLQEDWHGKRIVELTGPVEITPNQVAAALAKLLHRDVTAQLIPRAELESGFRAQGMSNPIPRMQMLDGFIDGWIDFEGTPRRGSTSLEDALEGLIKKIA